MNLNLNFSWIKEAFAARRDPEGVRVLARLYWHVILVIAIICMLVAIIFGVSELYATLEALTSPASETLSSGAKLDRDELESELNALVQKENLFKSASTTMFTDPSL